MKADRRTFIKLAGLTVLGVGLRPAVGALAREDQTLVLPGVISAGADKAPLVANKWAMVVDPSKCDGCTDCMDACHRVHNVPHFDNPRVEIKWIWKESGERVFSDQTEEFGGARLREMSVPVLCNHCDNPACVKVCPTQATFKREDGIVMMDYHRCIGCRYCMVACPYGARSFNFLDPREGLDMKKVNGDYPTRSRGVVEKCDFCEERLAKGIIPACVEACKKEALVFGDVTDPNSDVRKILGRRYTIRRRPSLGTGPQVYYIVA